MLELMLAGFSSAEMAGKLAKPLSTVQRRSRNLIQSGLIEHRYELNYKKLGYRVAYLHVYVNGADVNVISHKVRQVDGAKSVSVHIGNSDIVAKYACKTNQELMEIIGRVRKIDGVQRVVWSEEVYALPPK
ncbi:MAG: Lrp/AsnC family transcriptional regulator [Nitrososphaera sp.]|uniref:Lrp/AsnC family transcriptional regulator n=1 Tax=Nitrososphaera sp. TaxID=1971748 RepID=UPI003D6DAE46